MGAARLYGAAVFKDASQLTEQQISAKVAMKVGVLLDAGVWYYVCVCVCVCGGGVDVCGCEGVCVCAVHYDWLPREPLSKPTDALSDTVHFLESTFAAVQPLPDELVTSIALQGLKTLQGKMEALLNSEKVGAIHSGRVYVVCEGAVLCFRTPRSVWLGFGRLTSTSSCVRVSQTQWLCALCGVTFLICLPVCLSVCLSVCLCVCLCVQSSRGPPSLPVAVCRRSQRRWTCLSSCGW